MDVSVNLTSWTVNGSYTSEWTDNGCTFLGANNNSKGWAFARCGGKNTSATSTIKYNSKVEVPVDSIVLNTSHGINGTSGYSVTITGISVSAYSDEECTSLVSSKDLGTLSYTNSNCPKSIKIAPATAWEKDLYYVISVSWTETGNKNAGLDISGITFYEVPTSNPSLSATPTTLAFGNVLEDTYSDYYSYEATKEIHLTGSNLTGDVSLSASGDFQIAYPYNPTSAGYKTSLTIKPQAGAIDTTIVMASYTRDTGGKSGTLTISSDASEFSDVIVDIYMTLVPKPSTIDGAVVDEIGIADLGVTSTSYTAFTDKQASNTGHSSAVYAGTIARNGNETQYNIQLNSGQTNNKLREIASSTSGGTLKRVIAWWATQSTNVADRKLSVYGSNDAYAGSETAATGTLIGDLTYAEGDLYASLDVTESYKYVQIVASAAVYADRIDVAWMPKEIDDPAISGQTPFYPSTTVSMSIVTDGADIVYTLDGEDPIGGDNTYTAPFTLTETTTVKARGFKGVKLGDIVTKEFVKATPISVTDAIALIPNDKDKVNDQFVVGYVCTAGTSVSSGQMTYSISADGTETNSLKVYNGKGLNNTDFTDITDLAVGDKVVIFGQLYNYNNGTYELNSGNYIVERVAKGDVSSIDLTGTNTKTAFEFGDHFDPLVDGDYVVKATYANGYKEEVTSLCSWKIDGNDIATYEIQSEGSASLTATYSGKSDWVYIEVAKINKHKITFSAPEHGTLVVKWLDSAIDSGDEWVKTREFTVVATPDEGYQLATLTANGVDISSTKAFTMGTEDIVVAATFTEIPHVYSVVGTPDIIPAGWDQTSTLTEMTLNEGVYSYKLENVTLTASTNYEYKIVEDHAWTVAYPQSGNATFSVDKSGRYDVTFTLNKSTKAYAAIPELIEEIAVNRTFVVLGSFNGWSATPVEVEPDAATASFVLNLTAGDYTFKVQANGAWLANGYTYHRDYTGADGITSNGDDMTLAADENGEYIFTWTYATNSLQITFPAKKSYPELSWSGIDEYNRAWAYREGRTFDFPTLLNPHDLSITYSSDDGGTIISINETTGAIELKSEGMAHITATSAETSTYKAGSVTYTLYVCGPTSIAISGAVEKLTYEYGDPFDHTGLTAILYYNNGGGTYDVTEQATWTYNKETITSGGSVLVTVSYVGQSDEKYIYDVKVAAHAVTWTQPAVGGTFEVLDNTYNPFASGTTYRRGIEITVVPSAAPNYELAALTANGVDIMSTKKFTIGTEDVVIAATFNKVPVAAGLEWSTSTAYVRMGSATNDPPYLVNPNGVEVTYESSNESIATIAANGAISLKANGQTTLRAIFAGNEDYLAQTVECTLNVAAGIVTITPAAPVALELGNVPFGSTPADYGQSFHLNITNLISGQYNQVKIDFTGSAFWTAGNNYITDNDQDGVIDVDVTIVPSEYWWTLSEANALGEQNTTITLMCIGSAQFEDVVVGTATMKVVESTPTAIDNVEVEQQARKVIINDKMYIIRGEKMYDAQGKLVK